MFTHNCCASSWETTSPSLETWVARFFLLFFRTHKRAVLTCLENLVFRITMLLSWSRPLSSFTRQTQTPAPPSLQTQSSPTHIHPHAANQRTHIPIIQPTWIHTVIRIHGTLSQRTPGIQVTQSAWTSQTAGIPPIPRRKGPRTHITATQSPLHEDLLSLRPRSTVTLRARG